MAVRFIEGWDLGVNISADQFVHNWNQYWSNNFESITYTDGYSAGQGMIIKTGIEGLSKGPNQIPNDGEMRIHFWGKLTQSSVDTGYRPIFALRRNAGVAEANDCWMVEINGQGFARLSIGTVDILGDTSSVTVLDGPTINPVVDDIDWNFFELYANELTGELRFFHNGTEILTALNVSPVPEGTNAAHFSVSTPGTAGADNDIILDHIVVSDGESLVNAPVSGVAIGCAIEGGVGGTTQGFLGHLVIDGVSYKTTVANQSLDGSGSGDDNYAPNTYFPFPTNPATGTAWSADGLANIDAWGVCYNDDSQTSRLTDISLMTVVADPATGFPIIQNTKAGTALYLSGNWTKTNDNLTYGGHLQDIPMSALRSTDEWLSIEGEGCILFNDNSGGILTSFGITFAEEYREDFLDWFSIDEIGVNYESYFFSGYTILGDSNKKFQSNYVTVNYEDVPVGGAYLQGVWDYAQDGNTGRWSVRQQIYNDKGNYKYQQRKLKVRGHGTALQFRIGSEEGKDFKINGWAIQASGNSGV